MIKDVNDFRSFHSTAYGLFPRQHEVQAMQSCVLQAALALLDKGKVLPKRAHPAGYLLVPYCARELQTKGRRILLNRMYKPIGTGGEWVDYDRQVQWHIPDSFVARLELEESGYFFDDGSSPFVWANRKLHRRVAGLIELIADSDPYEWLVTAATDGASPGR